MFQAFNVLSEGLPSKSVDIRVNNSPVSVPQGMSVAAALMYLNKMVFRYSAVTQSPRGPYCMMGTCFECLVEIDGEKNLRACQIEVLPGMEVNSLDTLSISATSMDTPLIETEPMDESSTEEPSVEATLTDAPLMDKKGE